MEGSKHFNYIHTEIYSLKSHDVNFMRKWPLANVFHTWKKPYIQSESRTMFFHGWENWYVQSKAKRCVSFTPKFSPFLSACKRNGLALRVALQTFKRKDPINKIFSRRKVRKIAKSELKSLSLKKIEEGRQNNGERGKTEREVSLYYIQTGHFTQNRSFLFVH